MVTALEPEAPEASPYPRGVTDHLWHQRDPMQASGPAGAGRTSAGWFALALVLVWSAAMALALSVANSVSAADLASTAVPRHPLDDPPVPVARAEFLVGLIGITALPSALVVIGLGYRGVVRGWVAGHRVGWVALCIGALGLLPALLATIFGVVICVFDGEALTAG
ncbi:hypothetical protein GCM10009706_14920 [Curtobacterium citreum]|nr:hypothetical protein FB462_1362 [Curtobacterium citreum]GGL77462.1 hypothetical protein GCM10009706_14920 [Curtobacterium citreum]